MGGLIEPSPPLPAPFERNARRDGRFWLALVFGGVILLFDAMAGSPEACRISGNCSVLLSAALRLVGGIFIAIAAVALWLNGRSGSRINPVSGELEWWQDRRPGKPGREGRIHPRDIGRIRIVRRDERQDDVSLIDRDGCSCPNFDAEVLPWRFEDWAAQLVAAYPHIIVEERA